MQECEFKFNQLYRYAPHMVADSGVQMNKFLYGVSYFMIKECKNVVLLGDMRFCRLMLNKLRVMISVNIPTRIRRLGTEIMTTLRKSREV